MILIVKGKRHSVDTMLLHTGLVIGGLDTRRFVPIIGKEPLPWTPPRDTVSYDAPGRSRHKKGKR